MDACSILALLGLIAIGASNLSYTAAFVFVFIWMLGFKARQREIRLAPGLEAVLFFCAFLFVSFAGVQDVHVYVRLGNALAFIQLLRNFRRLNRREKTASVFISFTHVAISSQVVLGPQFILILAAFILFFPAALEELEGGKNRKTGCGFRDFAKITAVGLLFFLFFPRIGTPKDHLSGARLGAPAGFPESPRRAEAPGDSLLMLVEGEDLGPMKLYTLDRYEGAKWRRTSKSRREKRSFPEDGPLLDRKVIILDLPRFGGFLPHDGEIVYCEGDYFTDCLPTTGGDYRIRGAARSGAGRYSYSISGTPREQYFPGEDLSDYLQTPDFSPKIHELVSGLTGGAENEEEKIEAFTAYLQSTFAYKAESGREAGFSEFLLVHKSGSCRDFAGALAMMLRMRGIPSRLAAGYLPRARGAGGSRHRVHENDGHAWVEAHIEGAGWISVDPTPSVPEEGAPEPFFYELRERMADFWYWKIIGFSLPEQRALIGEIISFLRRRALAAVLLFAALALFYVLKKRKPHPAWGRLHNRFAGMFFPGSPQTAFFSRMEVLLLKFGYQRARGETPLEFAGRIKKSGFEAAREVQFISGCFCRARYGGEAMEADAAGEAKRALAFIKKL